MIWIVNASIISIVNANTASEASDWVIKELAEKYGQEFIHAAIIRTSLREDDDVHDGIN